MNHSLQFLPLVNACLNGVAGILLVAGLIHIKAGRRDAHRKCMVAAFVTSCVFLVLYLTHKYLLKSVHTPFKGPEFLRSCTMECSFRTSFWPLRCRCWR